MTDSLLQENDQTLTKDAIIAKWKDKPREELENAKAESDLYVHTLTARLDDLRKDYLELKEQQQTGAQLKDLLDRLDNPNKQQEMNETPNVQNNQPGIKPEDIEALVNKKLTDHQINLKKQDNFNAMQAKLKQTFGDDYASAYKQRLDNLGLNREFADELAMSHPSVFIKTFGLDAVPQSTQPNLPRNQVRPSFSTNTQKRDWAYYQEMKKTNPKLYLDPKIAVQMHDDAIALGADFGLPED